MIFYSVIRKKCCNKPFWYFVSLCCELDQGLGLSAVSYYHLALWLANPQIITIKTLCVCKWVWNCMWERTWCQWACVLPNQSHLTDSKSYFKSHWETHCYLESQLNEIRCWRDGMNELSGDCKTTLSCGLNNFLRRFGLCYSCWGQIAWHIVLGHW